MNVCLDASAVLTWLQNDPSAPPVEEALVDAEQGTSACFLSTFNMGEVYYWLSRTQGSGVADRFWEQVSTKDIPITLMEATRRRVREAAVLRGLYQIPYGDAFAVQLAVETTLPLLTGDPEVRELEGREEIDVVWLGAD